MRHYSEDELIAYQLGESGDKADISKHLDGCLICDAMSDSIAETLRVFSAAPVPEVDLERNWQRVRGNLRVLERESLWVRLGLASWGWGFAALAAAAVLIFAVLFGWRERSLGKALGNVATLGRSGPLTAQPVDMSLPEHLDAAERLLTEVNHASGPLDDVTRNQAHALSLKNAVYVSRVHQQGDFAQIAVLESLGRVLTAIDNESVGSDPSRRGYDRSEEKGIRLEMNTGGLLLEIRILRQNDDLRQ